MNGATWVEAMPAVVACFYLAAALGYWRQGQTGWAFAYLAYAAANGGLIAAAIQGRMHG